MSDETMPSARDMFHDVPLGLLKNISVGLRRVIRTARGIAVERVVRDFPGESEQGQSKVERTEEYKHNGLRYRVVVERDPAGWVGTWQCLSDNCGIQGSPVISDLSADDALRLAIINTELMMHRYMGHRPSK